MNLRKYMALLLAAVILFVFSACGVPDWQNSSSSSEESSEPVEVKEEDYEDSLSGLCDYMTALGYVQGDKTDMQAEIIGASAGVKYTFSAEKVAVTAEIYEFDPEKLDETGRATIESAKANGYITVLETEVNAILSDSGKYLLIYTESAKNEAFTAMRDEAVAKFKAFKNA